MLKIHERQSVGGLNKAIDNEFISNVGGELNSEQRWCGWITADVDRAAAAAGDK